MLQNIPLEPFGQEGSFALSSVHCWEHTGWPAMSMVSVQTWLSQSGALVLALPQAAPNVRGAGPAASGPGAGVLPEQAHRTNDQVKRSRCMTIYPTGAARGLIADHVTAMLHAMTSDHPTCPRSHPIGSSTSSRSRFLLLIARTPSPHPLRVVPRLTA